MKQAVKQVRLLQILNRNLSTGHLFSVAEVKKCFAKERYEDLSKRESVILAKFLKECDKEDLEEIKQKYKINGNKIFTLFITSPYKKLQGLQKWHKHTNKTKTGKSAHEIKQKSYIKDFLKAYESSL